MMIKNVLITNNLYCLLIYLLLIDEEVIDQTYYFFSSDVPDDIKNKFSHSVKFEVPNNFLSRWCFIIKLRILRATKYSFIKGAQIYGQDNLVISSPLIGRKRIRVIEDGIANYTYKPHKRKFPLIKSVLAGPLLAKDTMGFSSIAEIVYLTSLAQIPNEIQDKVRKINLLTLWGELASKHKEIIEDYFCFDKEIIKEANKWDSILLTQPLSEDGIVDEGTKIELYKSFIGEKPIVIKPHPREKTDYTKYFPGSKVIQPYVPIELMTLCGVKFQFVYTIFSTAVFAFKNKPTIFFAGTKIHPKIMEYYGNIELVDGKLISGGNEKG